MPDPQILLLSIIAAVIPALFYVLLIYWVDRYEKEPWWLLTAAFLWGAVPSIIIAFIFNSLLSVPLYWLAGRETGNALAASLIAPPVEETIKGLAVLGIFFVWRHEIDSPLDGIIYGAVVGMGFAMVENVYYFVTVYQQGGNQAWGVNIFMRGFVFGLNHALFTSMTGLGVAVARMATNSLVRVTAPVAGWMAAMFLHFLHNAAVSTSNLLCFAAIISDWGGVMLVLIIIAWALLQERRWIKEYLAAEVAADVLTLKQYQIACSGWQRIQFNLNQLFSHGLRAYRQAVYFFYRCSELAYKKHHFTLFQDEKSAQLITKLRAEISEMSRYVT